MNRRGRIALVLGLVAVVLMAFRVSWNALSDVARAIGADSTAALLYPIVVDGLMALALVATLVLTGTDRKFALRVLATYTIASLLLNYVHGLVPALHTESIRWGRLADWDPANWALVLLATSLPVGSIYFGSDLVAKVLHHTPRSTGSLEGGSGQSVSQQVDQSADEQVPQSMPDRPTSTPARTSESAPAGIAKAPVPRPTEEAESATSPRPHRSAAVAKSTGAAPRRATGRVPAAAKSTASRARTDDQVLAEARLLTADWSDDQLSAERLRSELRIGQLRARNLRDRLQAERKGQAEPTANDGLEGGLPDGRDEAASHASAA
ncbi:DUF2637 domain-containing protein [Streptomyces sp. NPDC003006]